MNTPTELHLKYRPAAFKQMIGQPEAVRVLHQMVRDMRVPHALMLSGPSGVGKTTLARILKTKLNCSDSDFQEINAADFRGIDMVRDIRSRMRLRPLDGDCRMYLIDECHQLTTEAQNSLLKSLEDTPEHVYFILATTNPAKLLRTIVTRCTEIKLRELKDTELAQLIAIVAEEEGLPRVTDDVMSRIIEFAQGSARAALVSLNKIVGIEDEAEQLATVSATSSNKEAVELARALLKGAGWNEVSTLIKAIETEPESLRWMVLGYMSAVLLSGGGQNAARCMLILEEFRDNWFDTKKAGLVRACYAVCTFSRR